MKTRIVTFSKETVSKADDFFQSEVRCTADQLAAIVGFQPEDASDNENMSLKFTGAAYIDGKRIVPFIAHDWIPNHRDNPPEYTWHIRTTFYQDGIIIRDFLNSVLHPEEN